MENRAPKQKHCYIAEVFCSFSILVSSVTNAIHNKKQNAGIHNRKLLCFLIAWIVPSFGSIPWEKREWQAGILSAHCLHNRRWELHYASCFAQEWINIGRRVRPIHWDDIYSPMCHSPLSLHAPNLTKAGESQWTYPWGWCHQTQFKAKAGAKSSTAHPGRCLRLRPSPSHSHAYPG